VARYRIPNALTATLAAAALLFAWPHGGAEWAARGLSFALLGGAALGLHAARGLGGGDVKLLAATGLWIPAPSLALFVLALALAGGVQALAVLTIRRAASPSSPPRPAARMPYALSIAAAGLCWAAVRQGGT
jgi:prepilin peptidase CpaA